MVVAVVVRSEQMEQEGGGGGGGAVAAAVCAGGLIPVHEHEQRHYSALHGLCQADPSGKQLSSSKVAELFKASQLPGDVLHKVIVSRWSCGGGGGVVLGHTLTLSFPNLLTEAQHLTLEISHGTTQNITFERKINRGYTG